jgi:hypothetical protein
MLVLGFMHFGNGLNIGHVLDLGCVDRVYFTIVLGVFLGWSRLYHYQEIQTAYSQTDWMTSTKLFKLKLLRTLPQSLIDWSFCPYMKFITQLHK